MRSISFIAKAYAELLEKTHDKNFFAFKLSVMQVVGSGIILAVI
jgi:hypothetical protein